MKWQCIISWIIIPLMLAGCVPDALYQWSPDGKWMTVSSDNQPLRIADSDGKLLPGQIDHTAGYAWYEGDSRHILAVVGTEAKTWAEIVPYATPEEIQAVKEAAARVRQFAMTYDWTVPNADNWSAFKDALTAQEKTAGRNSDIYSDYLGGAIGIFLRENADDQLRQKIPEAQWKQLGDMTQVVCSVDIFAFDPSAADVFSQEATAMKSLTGPVELRPSPAGKAFLANLENITNGEHFGRLWLVPNDGRHEPILIAEQAAGFPDWSSDGRDIVFVTPDRPVPADSANQPSLGTVNRLHVIGEDGNLLDKFPAPESLAGLICNEETRVRCLADGRIIFSSAQITLPCTDNDIPSRQELFAIEPGKLATVVRLFPQQTIQSIGDSAQYFEVSPDGKFASIPNHDGKVSVVELASGAVTQVQNDSVFLNSGGRTEETLRCDPTWRISDQLTYAAPRDNYHWDVLLWSASGEKTKVLSSKWPWSFVSSDPTTQPSNAAATNP